jgi:ABC-2 type transport system ATP-binding protein
MSPPHLPDNDVVIEAKDLAKTYPGSRNPALRGITFRIQRGEIYGLLGPNGAGKTTTVSILTTQRKPSGGTAEVMGFDVVARPRDVRRCIGLTPQEQALYGALTARENLAYFASLYGVPFGKRRARVEEALTRVGLTTRADEAVKGYSGGMRQRLNIAIGLVHSPLILFLDEPTAGVDAQSRRFILDHVASLRDQGITVFYTTHYIEEAQELCDRISIMDEGAIVAEGAPGDLIAKHGEDVVHVRLPQEPPPELARELGKLACTRDVREHDRELEVVVTEGPGALVEIVGALERKSVRPLSLELRPRSLEGAFLALTGKSLRD